MEEGKGKIVNYRLNEQVQVPRDMQAQLTTGLQTQTSTQGNTQTGNYTGLYNEDQQNRVNYRFSNRLQQNDSQSESSLNKNPVHQTRNSPLIYSSRNSPINSTLNDTTLYIISHA